jgi:2-aminobenzoate-CoA ligase
MPMPGPSAHVDSFARDNLPPGDLWPELHLDGFDYPDRLNAAVELTDRMVEQGFGDHVALIGNGRRAPTRNWPTGPTASPMRWSRISA